MPQNGEIWKVKLYPVSGSEQDGIRPCLVVSPDSMNNALQTVIVLPMTRSLKEWPTRINIRVGDMQGQACIEHIRSISKNRCVEKMGKATDIEMAIIRKHIQAVFSS